MFCGSAQVDRLGRQRVVKLFINLIRWLRTVHSLRLLPPAPPAQLLVPFYRDSPYPGDILNPVAAVFAS